MKLSELRDEMRNRIKRALNRTWQAMREQVLGQAHKGEVKRAMVIDLVLNEERVRNFGRDNEAAEVLYRLERTEQVEMGLEAFHYGRYR